MPNVFITNICNLRCRYCFAKGMLGAANPEEMTMDEVMKVADFVKRSDGPASVLLPSVISLLGGEPTLHSQFPRIVDSLIEQGLIIKLFSNGTFPRERADYLAKLPEGKVNIILNINKRDTYTPTQWENVVYNLTHLNKMITLGFTIFQTDFDYQTVLQYITRFDLKRDIRLGISMPIVNATNAFVTYPEYKVAAKRILQFAEESFEQNVTIGFDCGFILCMFSRKELGRLKQRNVRLNFVCDGAIDIGKNGRTWRCFPLYSIHNTDYTRFDSVNALKDHYNALLPVKGKGISGACGRCRHYRQRNCSGGCYGYEYR
jgi:sulfatase maturation enzyme AslB (radical SAM superfamily)